MNSYNLRRKLGLSQEQMAARLGVSTTTVRNWEHGRRAPTGLYRKALEALAGTVTPACPPACPKHSDTYWTIAGCQECNQEATP